MALPFILALGAFCQFPHVEGEKSAALGAGLGEGSKIGAKPALRVVTAAVEDALLFAHSFYQLTAALRAVDPNLDLIGFGGFALGITTAGQELAVASHFDCHWLAAFRAGLLG